MEHQKPPVSSTLSAPRYTAWQLIKAFWQSNEKFFAFLFLGAVIFLTISLVALDVVFNYWYNDFYDALQDYDKYGVISLLFLFFAIAAVYILFAVYRYYLSQKLALRWRKWLTEQFVARWLEKKGYYYLENFDEKTDNPDQRIQEDILALVNYTLDLSIGLISAVTTIFAFIYVLWTLSGKLVIPLGSYGHFVIQGYLVWVGIIYALVGTLVTFKLGRPLISLNFEQQRREATFRFATMDLRAHAEHVALYKGEHHQKTILQNLFSKVLDNWYLIILRQKLLLWFTAGYNQASVILPLVVALPNYFNRVFKLGGLIQTLQAFNRVQDALSFLVNSYTTVAQWRAVTQRLTTFINHLNEAEDNAEKENDLVFNVQANDNITTRDVTINTPYHVPLLEDINEEFKHGQHYLIKGPSGIGKSTFVRTIAGIWPFGSGEITMPKQKQVMYLPQRPYMPIGTLSEAILFPDKQAPELEQHLAAVLAECRLDHLVKRLNETAPWDEQLSPGEQQRVAFARVLLHKPDWVFMDESTSMLDLANEKYLYGLLRSRLPHCSLVSVGHRPSLDEFHDHIIDMTKYSSAKRDDELKA